MNLLPRAIVSLAGGALSSLLGFLATFYLIALTDSCDRRVHVCDIAPLAGYAIGLVTGPIIGLVAAALLFRRLRNRAESARSHDA